MAEELFVRMVDINQLLPNCCEVCREQIEDLRAVRLDGERLDGVKNLLERVNDEAKRLMRWANEPISELRPRITLSPLQMRELFDGVQRATELSYKMPLGTLLKKTHEPIIAGPRQVSMYIMREMTFASFPQIGRHFDMHHTTVMYSIAKVENQLPKDKELNRRIGRIVTSVRNGAQ